MVSDSIILKHIARQPKRSAGFKQLVRELGLRGEERRELDERLQKLAASGALIRSDSDRYAVPQAATDKNLVAGRLTMHRDGFGFVIPDAKSLSPALKTRLTGDIFIPPHLIGNAMHGDLVLVDVSNVRPDGRAEGRIVRPVMRAHPTVVGIFHEWGPARPASGLHGAVDDHPCGMCMTPGDFRSARGPLYCGKGGLERVDVTELFRRLELLDIVVGKPDSSDLAFFLEVQQRLPVGFDRRVVFCRPMHLIEINPFDFQSAQRVFDLPADARRIPYLPRQGLAVGRIGDQPAFREDVGTLLSWNIRGAAAATSSECPRP